MIDFRSDNTGRAAPQILEALIEANRGTALGYGADPWTAAVQQRFAALQRLAQTRIVDLSGRFQTGQQHVFLNRVHY